jgi:predicted RNA-binding Zn-ribbon protein involved in translation (DUF1610 family)
MLVLTVADIEVKHRTVEVPEKCPGCGTKLATWDPDKRAPVRERNLTSSNFLGRFADDPEHPFRVDPRSSEERPFDEMWVPTGYECTNCGEVLATGTLDAA